MWPKLFFFQLSKHYFDQSFNQVVVGAWLVVGPGLINVGVEIPWWPLNEDCSNYSTVKLGYDKFCFNELRIIVNIFNYCSAFQCSVKLKDAGFVYESLRIETNRVIWDFCFYETNPRYESLRFGFANLDSQICNFRIRKDSDSRISIFKDSFRAIVLRIRKDS